ncbi:hypothetical protein G9A89_009579 [Geosiphon pyriformis]|nr:hypothetical protein G9A89_009579 [Geosiphon pyriformis]
MSNSWKRVNIHYNVQLLLENVNLQSTDSYNIQEKRPKTSATTTSKVATQTDPKTLEYYQSIYTHCKQRFNIPDRIETFKKTLYQYIENYINNYLFGDYNISEVRHNLYENLIHYSCLNTQNFNSQTLKTYFQELNFNIIQYCKENYPVEQKFSLGFESETEKRKRKRKQKLRTTSNTPKTTAKHLQTPEQGTSFKLPFSITLFLFLRIEDFQSSKSPIQQQKPILTSTNFIDYLAENQSEETESEQETEDSENEEKMASTYITKIPEFTEEDSETSPQKWLDKVSKAGDQEPSKSVMTYLGKFNKLLRRIHQLETNEYYSNAQILDQFIAGLKDKLIKKVYPHAPENLATAIQQAKNYEMAMEEANCTKLVNLAIGKTSSAAEKKIDQLTKKRNNQCYFQPQQSYYLSPPARYLPRPQYPNHYYQSALQLIQQQYQQPSTPQYQVLARKLVQHNQFTPQNRFPTNNNRLNSNNQLTTQNLNQHRPNHYHTQPSYLMMPEEQDFYHTALSEGRAAAQQQNPSYTPTTIPPARIAENANLSDIFSFEFEANESPFLLNNAAVNEQKAITAMYTEAEAEGKPIHLILNSEFTGSIITYQLMQQLKRNVDRPAQTVIVTADGMKKTPVGEIDNFSFTIDGITISVKVLIMDVPQYQALIGNDWLQKANANLN